MKSFRFHTKSSASSAQAPQTQPTLSFWSVVLPIVFDMICGVLLIILGNIALKVTSYTLSGVMVILSAWLIITYIRSTPFQKVTEARLACGLALLVAGGLLVFKPSYLEGILPFVWGLALLFSAFLKVQYAFDGRALKVEKWWIMLIFSAFSLIVGILTLTDRSLFGDSTYIIVGIMLIAEAILDIVVCVITSKALKRLMADGTIVAPAPVAAPEAAPAAAPAAAPVAAPAAAPVAEPAPAPAPAVSPAPAPAPDGEKPEA